MANIERYIPSEAFRKWLYPVAIAVLSLLVGIGYITEELSYLIIGVVAAVLGLGTASASVVDDTKVAQQKEENRAKKETLGG